MSLTSKITELIKTANDATGLSDATLTEAIGHLVDGFGNGEDSDAPASTINMMSGKFTVDANMTSGHQIIAYIEPWGWTPSKVFAWRAERTYTAKMVIASALFNMQGQFVRLCAVGNSTGTAVSAAVNASDWTSLDQGYICLEYGNTLYLRAGTSRGLQAGEWNWLAVGESTVDSSDDSSSDSGGGTSTYTDTQKFDAILTQAKQDITSYSYSQSNLSTGLQNKSGNCAVLTEYVQIACDYLGIPCEIVYGTDDVSSTSNTHMVNRVTLDGTKYWSDLSGTLNGNQYGAMLEKQSSGTPYSFQNNQGNNCYVLYPEDGTYKQLPSCSLSAVATTVTTTCSGASQTAATMKNSYSSCYDTIASKFTKYK